MGALLGRLQIAGLAVAQSNDTRAALSSGVLATVSKPEVSSGIKSQLLYRPLANTLTFGLYSFITGPTAPHQIKEPDQQSSQQVLATAQ